MQLKITQAVKIADFLEMFKSKKLSFKTMYHLTLLAQEVQKHVEFYNNAFRSIIMEYGKKDENGELVLTDNKESVLLAEETTLEAHQKLTELQALDVELPEIKFSLDEFQNIEITAEEMLTIMPFISE